MSTRCSLFCLCLLAVLPLHAAVITDLRITQVMEAQPFGYSAAPAVSITFTLTKRTAVTVTVKRHLPAMRQWQGAYLAEPAPVRVWALGTLAPGAHTVTWDGLDAHGQAITYNYNVPNAELRKLTPPPTAAQLTKPMPVNLLQVCVSAGRDTEVVNFLRAAGAVDASRRCAPFIGAVRDVQGNAVVAARFAWRGRRYTPAWALDATFPGTSTGHSSDPVETYDCAVDGAGRVYMATRNGVYKFAADGAPLAWEANADYINYPYPSAVRSVLGVRLDPNAQGKKDYVFGPGGGGAHKFWDTAGMIEQPGFAFDWAGLAVDQAGTIYAGRAAKHNDIQVFASSGQYLRTLPLPAGAYPQALRLGVDGALWECDDYHLLRLDVQTGAVTRDCRAGARGLHVGPDGTLYAFSTREVYRFTPAGDPLPFDPKLPTVHGNVLSPTAGENKAPADAAAYPREILGVVGNADGSFDLCDRADDDAPVLLRHFDAGGHFVPELVSVQTGQRVPGNVFLDDAPATFDLFATNLATEPATLTVAWTLTDYDGHVTTGTAPFSAAARARQTLSLIVPAPVPGHYTLAWTVRQGTRTVGADRVQLARLPSRPIAENRYSPFAIAWGTDFPLMAYVGVKSQRGDNDSWAGKVEPLEGVRYPDPPDAVTYNESIEGYRRYARRWGDDMLHMLDYGESWLGGDYPACRLFSYDRYYRYCLEITDRLQGKGESFYQFWNEPNFFWHVPGAFSREHFGLVDRFVWNIVKARDRDALLIPDGDAGGTGMMRELAQRGGSAYTDAVLIHYPGAAPLTFDKMPVPDLPEGKIPMVRNLLAIRDADYPGKPVWNTEEGWWGGANSPHQGARVLPRIYLTQLAAGVDKLYWFAQTSEDDPSYLLDGNNYPNPAYLSYGTMTRLLEGASYLGRAATAAEVYVLVFARGREAIVAAWCVRGAQRWPLPAPSATVEDLMGRTHTVAGTLTLSEDVQYLHLPLNHWVRGIARQSLDAQLAAQGVKTVAALPAAVAEACRSAATDNAAMTRLHYLVRAAETAAYAGEMPALSGPNATAARAGVTSREGADGYLCRARLLLGDTERLQSLPLPARKADVVALAARAAIALAGVETPVYPGVAVNAYIGDPGEVERIRAITPVPFDYTTTIDEKFRFQLIRRPGERCELELTVWNFYRHPITVLLRPRVPAGWQVDLPERTVTLTPGACQRVTGTVTLPADAAPGIYTLGGAAVWEGNTITEIYAQRVQVPGP